MRKKAAYKRWSNGAWIDLGSNSQLNSEQYQNNITLQNRGIAIVRQILEDYDDGTIGVNLVFEGTDNDFEDLQNILTLYFPEKEYKITCTRDDKRLISADDAAQEIESIFAKMEQTFEENPSEELQAEIDRYKKTVKSTVTVCILGTYSAGKSAFINALIGEENPALRIRSVYSNNLSCSHGTGEQDQVRVQDAECRTELLEHGL